MRTLRFQLRRCEPEGVNCERLSLPVTETITWAINARVDSCSLPALLTCSWALQVLHIHCRHGDGDFSKFEFFKHHYDTVDLTTLEINVVKDYATLLAVGTWRTLGKGVVDPPIDHAEL